MAIEPSAGVADFLLLLSGEKFPASNEDRLFALATVNQQAAKGLLDSLPLLSAGVQVLRDSVSGEAEEAMVAALEEYVRDPGYLGIGAKYINRLGHSYRDLGTQVEYTKLMTIAAVIELMIEFAIALAFSFFNPAAALEHMAIAREIFKFLYRTWLRRILVGAAVAQVIGITMQVLMDVIVQRYQIAHGSRDHWDPKLTRAAAEVGSLGGAVGLGLGELGGLLANLLKKAPKGGPGLKPNLKPDATPDPKPDATPDPKPDATPDPTPQPSPGSDPKPRPFDPDPHGDPHGPDPDGPGPHGPGPDKSGPPGGTAAGSSGTSGPDLPKGGEKPGGHNDSLLHEMGHEALTEYLTEGLYGVMTGEGWQVGWGAPVSGAVSALAGAAGTHVGAGLNQKYGPDWDRILGGKNDPPAGTDPNAPPPSYSPSTVDAKDVSPTGKQDPDAPPPYSPPTVDAKDVPPADAGIGPAPDATGAAGPSHTQADAATTTGSTDGASLDPGQQHLGGTATPGDSTATDSTPAASAPADSAPTSTFADPTPADTASADSTPTDPTPTDAAPTGAPTDSTPTDSTPAASAPADSAPTSTFADPTPADTASADSTPTDPTPTDAAPGDTTPAHGSPTSTSTDATPIVATPIGTTPAGAAPASTTSAGATPTSTSSASTSPSTTPASTTPTATAQGNTGFPNAGTPMPVPASEVSANPSPDRAAQGASAAGRSQLAQVGQGQGSDGQGQRTPERIDPARTPGAWARPAASDRVGPAGLTSTDRPTPTPTPIRAPERTSDPGTLTESDSEGSDAGADSALVDALADPGTSATPGAVADRPDSPPGTRAPVSAAVADAVERLDRWDGEPDCADRVARVLRDVGGPAAVRDDGSGSRPTDVVARQLGGRFHRANLGQLAALRPGSVTAVWVERPNDPMHMVLVEHTSDGRFVMTETQVRQAEDQPTASESATAGPPAGRFVEFTLPAGPTGPGWHPLPHSLAGPVRLAFTDDGQLAQVAPPPGHPPAPADHPASRHPGDTTPADQPEPPETPTPASQAVSDALTDPSTSTAPHSTARPSPGMALGGMHRGTTGGQSTRSYPAMAPNPAGGGRSAIRFRIQEIVVESMRARGSRQAPGLRQVGLIYEQESWARLVGSWFNRPGHTVVMEPAAGAGGSVTLRAAPPWAVDEPSGGTYPVLVHAFAGQLATATQPNRPQFGLWTRQGRLIDITGATLARVVADNEHFRRQYARGVRTVTLFACEAGADVAPTGAAHSFWREMDRLGYPLTRVYAPTSAVAVTEPRTAHDSDDDSEDDSGDDSDDDAADPGARGALSLESGGHWNIFGRADPRHEDAVVDELVRAAEIGWRYGESGHEPGRPVPVSARRETLALVRQAVDALRGGLQAHPGTLDLTAAVGHVARHERPDLVWRAAIGRLARQPGWLSSVRYLRDAWREPGAGRWRSVALPAQVRRMFEAEGRYREEGAFARRRVRWLGAAPGAAPAAPPAVAVVDFAAGRSRAADVPPVLEVETTARWLAESAAGGGPLPRARITGYGNGRTLDFSRESARVTGARRAQAVRQTLLSATQRHLRSLGADPALAEEMLWAADAQGVENRDRGDADAGRRVVVQVGYEQSAAPAGQWFTLAAEDAPAAGLPVVSSLVRGEGGRWLADGAEVSSSLVPGARGGRALLSAAELALVAGRELLPDGRSVPVLVHGVGEYVRVPVREPGGGVREVLLSPGQLAEVLRDTLAPDATVALLSCRSGALAGGFAQRLASALGREVLAPVGDLRVGVADRVGPAARLLSEGGQPWMLFVPDGLGGEGWDTVNDEIDGVGADMRAFDGFAAVAPPPAAGAGPSSLHLGGDRAPAPQVPSAEPGSAPPAAAVAPVPDPARWLRESSVPHQRRSAALRRVDTALAEYDRRRDGATTTDQARLALLGRVQEEIVAWRADKRAERHLPAGSDVPSRRNTAVEQMEDAVEHERLVLLEAMAGAVAVGPAPRDHYGHVAVYSAGAMVDNKGGFVAGSAAEYGAARARLAREGAAPTELDVRVRMLTDKIRAAHADFERRKASDPDAAGAIALFTVPEWFFKRPGTPFTRADKQQVVHTVVSLSAQHPGMLIVPGSVVWGTGRSDGAELRSTTMAALNGRRLHEQDKRKEALDADGYYPDDWAGDDTIQRRRYAEWERGGGLRTGADAGRDPREVPPNVDGQPAAFQVGPLTFALEICADNVNGRALWDFGQGWFPRQRPADVHVLVSAGASPLPSKGVLREGGIAVGNDGQDRSPDRRTGAERKVWVARKAAKPYWAHPDLRIDGERFTFAGQPERVMDRYDQLDDMFLGLFALPGDTTSSGSTAPATAPASTSPADAATGDDAETGTGVGAGGGHGRRRPSLGSLHDILSHVSASVPAAAGTHGPAPHAPVPLPATDQAATGYEGAPPEPRPTWRPA